MKPKYVWIVASDGLSATAQLPETQLSVLPLETANMFVWFVDTDDGPLMSLQVEVEPEPYPTLEAAQVACENFYWRHILSPEATQ